MHECVCVLLLFCIVIVLAVVSRDMPFQQLSNKAQYITCKILVLFVCMVVHTILFHTHNVCSGTKSY